MLAKYLDNGDIAIGVFNFTDGPLSRYQATITPDLLGLPEDGSKILELTNLWTGEVLKPAGGVIQIEYLDAHDCLMFRAKVAEA